MRSRRNIPVPLQQLLNADAYLTEKFCNLSNNFLPLHSLRVHYKILEITCHGIPWLCLWMVFIWWFDNPRLYQMQVNFFIGLWLDIALVAVIKAVTRRRRPAANRGDMFATMGPDKFSFPSGHASRAAFVAYFLLQLWPVPVWVAMPVLAWATCVCLTRVLLRRHHLLDVGAGIGLGILEGMFVGWLWLSHEVSAWLISWLSDEKLDGGSYHV
ncbi:polyisoprenoid diphosphate/phosphate phosphohydrolase PLPP6 isoform X2 [Bacillus rossius redtenbacheri]